MNWLYSKVKKRLVSELIPWSKPYIEEIFIKKIYLRQKLFNFLLNVAERKQGKSLLRSLPYYTIIDPSNVCNLKCPFCPTWQNVKARPKNKMELNMFKRILDEIGPTLFALNLTNWGEPLLNPDLPEMIRYAKRFNVAVGFGSNLNHLPDRFAEELIDSGVDIIIISIDGISQETYGRYRQGGNLENVLNNLRKLISLRSSRDRFPLVVWQFLVSRYNETEIERAREIAADLQIEFLAAPMRTPMGKELLLPLYERVEEIKDWLPKNTSFNRYAYDIRPESRTKQGSCNWLWSWAVISSNGSVTPCCSVFEDHWDFGRCHDLSTNEGMTFRKVWNGNRYQLARRLIRAFMKKSPDLGQLRDEAKAEGLICTHCLEYGFLEN